MKVKSESEAAHDLTVSEKSGILGDTLIFILSKPGCRDFPRGPEAKIPCFPQTLAKGPIMLYCIYWVSLWLRR